MAFSQTKCAGLAKKIAELEEAIHQAATHGMVRDNQTGGERTSWQPPTLSAMRTQLDQYRRDYAKGSCATILGNEDVDTTPRRGLSNFVVKHH